MGVDIESETGFFLFEDTVIDLAGYDLEVTGDGQCTLWSYANSELTDSVGGSILYNEISVSSGTLIFFYDRKRKCKQIPPSLPPIIHRITPTPDGVGVILYLSLVGELAVIELGIQTVLG